MADTYANKYLDGVGLAHLWEKIKDQSAKIVLIGFTGSTWEKILLQESNEKDKKYIKWLLSAEQDVMIEDVGDNNRRYYFVKKEKGDDERLDYIWESYSSSKIYRITVKGDSRALGLTKTEVAYHAATADSATNATNADNATNATYATNVGSSGNSLSYTALKNLNDKAVTTTNTSDTLTADYIIVGNDNRTIKSSGYQVLSSGDIAAGDNIHLPTAGSVVNYVTNAIEDATDDLVAIAEGKTKAYTITASSTQNSSFNTSNDIITISDPTNKTFTTVGNESVKISDLKVGDFIFLTNTKLPDRWLGALSETQATFYAVEGKVDLNGYVTGTGLTENTIILGNGNSGVKTSNVTIASSITNNQSTWTNIPNIGAIIQHVQPKLGALGTIVEPIYVSAAGTIAKCNKYAGGTAVTFNGESKAGGTASFYAPTAAGTSGQILKSSGSGAPTWVNQSTLSVGSATKATQDGNGNNIARTYVPKTSSSNEAQANITNENGEVIITSAESGFSVVPEGAALFSATQDDMNELVVNDKGAFMNKNRIVDYSMTLTTGEIDIICADN